MGNEIVDSILSAIKSEFGETYKIYTHQQEQGFIKPCFFVQILSLTNERFMGNRFFSKNEFNIKYLINANEENNNLTEVFEKLNNCLEIITIDGDLVRGSDIKCVISEEGINFSISYNGFTYKVEDKDLMEIHKLKL